MAGGCPVGLKCMAKGTRFRGCRTVATESQIQKVLTNLSEFQACTSCGTRFRFGDVECPHCGADLEDYLRQWAEQLINELELRA